MRRSWQVEREPPKQARQNAMRRASFGEEKAQAILRTPKAAFGCEELRGYLRVVRNAHSALRAICAACGAHQKRRSNGCSERRSFQVIALTPAVRPTTDAT